MDNIVPYKKFTKAMTTLNIPEHDWNKYGIYNCDKYGYDLTLLGLVVVLS